MLSAVLFFIISLLLLIQCSWNLSTFLRLTTAASLYSNNEVIESALQMSNSYIYSGKIASVICVIVSVCLVFISSINLGFATRKK